MLRYKWPPKYSKQKTQWNLIKKIQHSRQNNDPINLAVDMEWHATNNDAEFIEQLSKMHKSTRQHWDFDSVRRKNFPIIGVAHKPR